MPNNNPSSCQSPSAKDITLACRLHLSIAQLERKGSVWSAVQATWVALQQGIDLTRYFLFWVALEALFGSQSAELRYRLSQRIAFFIAKDRSEALEIYEKAKDGYDFRSQIAHGGWKENKDSQALLAESEILARISLIRVLLNDDLLKTFSGEDKGRNKYLDGLTFREFGLADQVEK
jgi:Apea-like HEPN